jgi:hypothetical protein
MLFGAAGAFEGTILQQDTFTHLHAGPAPASLLCFSAASLLASDPGFNQGPYGTPTCSNTLLTQPSFGNAATQTSCSPQA